MSGAKHRMGHYFNGDLTGLSLLRNQTDSEQVIRCFNGCQEKLDLAALDDMDTGMVGHSLLHSLVIPLLSHSLTQSFPHSVITSLSHFLTQSFPHSVISVLSHSLTQSFSRSGIPSLRHSLTQSFPYSVIVSISHFINHSFPH